MSLMGERWAGPEPEQQKCSLERKLLQALVSLLALGKE